jgi:hypothetical protein
MYAIDYYPVPMFYRFVRRHDFGAASESFDALQHQIQPGDTFASLGLCNRFGVGVNIDFWIGAFYCLVA